MKSFDELADDFVLQQAEHMLPYELTEKERVLLRIGYMTGLNAGIKFCAVVFAPIEEKGP